MYTDFSRGVATYSAILFRLYITNQLLEAEKSCFVMARLYETLYCVQKDSEKDQNAI